MIEQENKFPVGREEIRQAAAILERYRRGKAALDARIVENEEWYRLRYQGDKRETGEDAVSAWLFNSIANKHADAMDNYPEPVILPRSREDEAMAEFLGTVVPTVLERADFEETYSDAWWYKLKQGTAVYGVFWNGEAQGTGEVEIRRCDLLQLFWEPGVTDIQDSPHLFFVTMQDAQSLIREYPQLEGKAITGGRKPLAYRMQEGTEDAQKVAVVDWYTRKADETGRMRVHYCRFVGEEILFASQNDPVWEERGYYDHGMYPFIFDRMYYEEASPAGFGLIDVMKSPQRYIDRLNQALIRSALQAARKRYFIRDDGSVSEEEFADFSRELIHVTGNLGEDSIRELRTEGLPASVLNLLQFKIEELKETSGNRDFSQGGTASGVTAASAIAALQEAGSKLTRDMLKASYRSFVRLCRMVMDLIRQFYDEPRIFRMLGEEGAQYLPLSAMMIPEDVVFDVKVKAQKASSFARLTQNETVLELYRLGFFAPERADQALIALEAMDFEGRDAIIRAVRSQGTLQQQNARLTRQMHKMAQVIDAQNGSTIAQSMQEEGMV